MSQLPRNPRYFPRMKVRGKRRRIIAPIQYMTGLLERVLTGGKSTAESLRKFAEGAVPHEWV